MHTNPHSRRRRRGHALRRGRISIPGYAYLVTAVTDRRAPLFADFARASMAARWLDYPYPDNVLRSCAWVVMPDHVHWLLVPGEQKSLSLIMQGFKSGLARLLNEYESKPGRRIWQAGFHDHALRYAEDMRATARYVVANPLRAGLVTNIGDYPFWNAIWL